MNWSCWSRTNSWNWSRNNSFLTLSDYNCGGIWRIEELAKLAGYLFELLEG